MFTQLILKKIPASMFNQVCTLIDFLLNVWYAKYFIMFQVEHFLTLFHENDELQMDQSGRSFH